MSYQEQLKGEQPKSAGWIGFQRSKTDDVVNMVLILVLLALCVLVPVSKAISAANYQQSMKNFCADYASKHNATPVPVVGLFACDGSGDGLDAGFGCLLALAIAGFIVLLALLVQTIRRLNRPGLYNFDRHSDSFSLDGAELAHLSDIKEIRVKQSRSFALDVVYNDGNSTTLGRFWASGEANDAADQIATFLGVPKTHGMGFF